MQKTGRIGVFDSGLGGLYIANAVRQRMPHYDYVYLGDTLNVPYGRRSDSVIYDLSEKAMRFLFDQGCDLIIMACNTASAAALRNLQQGFLASHFPDRRILGVVIPTLESAIDHGATRIGLLATQRTVQSEIYATELQKINPAVMLTAVASPLLVPLIEDSGEAYLDLVLNDYLAPVIAARAQSLILGCTHYCVLKDRIARLTDNTIHIIAQDDIIPAKLENYLLRHLEMDHRLSRNGTMELYATDINENFLRNIADLCGSSSDVRLAAY